MIDVRKRILFDAVKGGKIKTQEQLVDLMIFLGFEDALVNRCLKLKKINTKHLDKLKTVIITGGTK